MQIQKLMQPKYRGFVVKQSKLEVLILVIIISIA